MCTFYLKKKTALILSVFHVLRPYNSIYFVNFTLRNSSLDVRVMLGGKTVFKINYLFICLFICGDDFCPLQMVSTTLPL